MSAWRWLGKFDAKWGRNLPRWRRAILIGQAKRLALMSAEESSAWGHSMLAKRGGHAVQRKYVAEGRIGKLHSAKYAALVRVLNQQRRKKLTQPGAGYTPASRLAGI